MRFQRRKVNNAIRYRIILQLDNTKQCKESTKNNSKLCDSPLTALNYHPCRQPQWFALFYIHLWKYSRVSDFPLASTFGSKCCSRNVVRSTFLSRLFKPLGEILSFRALNSLCNWVVLFVQAHVLVDWVRLLNHLASWLSSPLNGSVAASEMLQFRSVKS